MSSEPENLAAAPIASSRADFGTVQDDMLTTSYRTVEPGTAGTHRRPSTTRAVMRIAAFFGLVAAFALGTSAIIQTGFRRIATSDFGVTNRVVRGEINAEILITGSSRALTHYDARTIQQATGRSTFNIGLNGSQTDMQVALLKTYLAHNAKPKLLIHNLDLFSFVTSHEIYDPAQYMPYLGEEPIYTAVRRVYPTAWKWRYIPLYGYLVEDMRFTWLKGLKGFFGFQPPEDRFQGFCPRDLPWTGDFDKFREQNPEGVSFPIEAQGIRDLTEIAEICQREQIPLLFVYSPEYSDMQAIERNRAEIFGKFDELCARFDVPLWDFSTSAICRDRDNFYNSQHLNASGAALFSADLARRLAVKLTDIPSHLKN